MSKTIGVLAHVDAGKTTFSEQVLFHTHAIRKAGRVDHKDAFLDSHAIERQRGITVFADQADFEMAGKHYFWLDTPGHVDFAGEMERSIRAMDYGLVIVSGVEGVQGHTETVCRLLRHYGVPTLFFINKMDRDGADKEKVKKELERSCGVLLADFSDGFSNGKMDDTLKECLAELDDTLLEAFLEGEEDETLWNTALRRLVKEDKVSPCWCGSALQDQGVEEFLQDLAWLEDEEVPQAEAPFHGIVYKVRHDAQAGRVLFVKVLQGKLKPKDEVQVLGQDGQLRYEKINEVRFYSGAKFRPAEQAEQGDLCGVTGLSSAKIGDEIGAHCCHHGWNTTPLLMSKVEFPKEVHPKTMLGYLRQLEEEDPLLGVQWQEHLQEIQVHIMGVIQLEILKELVKERFGVEITFGPCRILYQETIEDTVVGYGHYEPLRHYSEVHLRLSPNERGKGITFESQCHQDVLGENYQNLIHTHVMEKEHKGVLTGSPLTDVHVTLLTGRAHIKHTEGGDFREAVYRAIRQGLMQAKSVLLEPYYAFSISAPSTFMGRIMADIQKRNGSFDPPLLEDDLVQVKGRGPAALFMEYPQEFTALTGGKGSIQLTFDGYEPCHNSQQVIEEIGYDCESDLENTSCSVFCSHGAGFTVHWSQVKDYIHCK
jgi:ribosomal protection tetracycline resistance protein